MDPSVTERLRDELRRWHDPWENEALRRHLADISLSRIRSTLELLPDASAESRLLELGASPYLTSVCLDVVWPGTVTHANYFSTGQRRGVQRLEADDGAEKTYAYDCFNVEADEFPYPDGTFDVVLFSELIEHLAVNPLWALAEIHRVLRPGGHVIVTTPNGVSIERFAALVRGTMRDVDRYAPTMGYGARHNREYHPDEVRELLETTGFDVESAGVRDVKDRSWGRRLGRRTLDAALRVFSRVPRGDHVFVRARRRPEFRWQFPPRLFAHLEMLQIVRHPWLEIGINDTIQCGQGWEPLERGPDGVPMRRIHRGFGHLPGATAVIRTVLGASRVRVRLRAVGEQAHGQVAVHPPGSVATVLGLAYFSSSAAWTDVVVPLTMAIDTERPVSVTIVPFERSEVAVHRVEIERPEDGAC